MPVTIPPFTNVPAPNDPVASAWAQQLTQFVVDDIQVGPTAPTSPNAELWYDTSDTGVSLPNWAGPWTAFTPTLTQPGAIAKNVTAATFIVMGKLVIAQIHLAITGAGTAGQPIKVGLPVAARAANAVAGFGQFYDLSAGTRFVCWVSGASTTEAYLAVNGASTDLLGVSPSIGLAANDSIAIGAIYEAA